MQMEMKVNGSNEVWTVETWREEFLRVKALMPVRWRTALAKFNSYFNTKDGVDMMDLVGDGRASLLKTAKVVNACKDYLAAIERAQPVEKSNMGGGYQPIYEGTKRLRDKIEASKLKKS